MPVDWRNMPGDTGAEAALGLESPEETQDDRWVETMMAVATKILYWIDDPPSSKRM